jgi:hypothetical protein
MRIYIDARTQNVLRDSKHNLLHHFYLAKVTKCITRLNSDEEDRESITFMNKATEHMSKLVYV